MTNTIDFETMQQVEKLTKTFGLDECKRLGFIHVDENGIAALSPVGLGYLLYIEGMGINTLAAAFAAGWHCASDFYKQDLGTTSGVP